MKLLIFTNESKEQDIIRNITFLISYAVRVSMENIPFIFQELLNSGKHKRYEIDQTAT